jgi:hypothetical protein
VVVTVAGGAVVVDGRPRETLMRTAARDRTRSPPVGFCATYGAAGLARGDARDVRLETGGAESRTRFRLAEADDVGDRDAEAARRATNVAERDHLVRQAARARAAEL